MRDSQSSFAKIRGPFGWCLVVLCLAVPVGAFLLSRGGRGDVAQAGGRQEMRVEGGAPSADPLVPEAGAVVGGSVGESGRSALIGPERTGVSAGVLSEEEVADWRNLLDAIRRAEVEPDPHRAAWDSVEALAGILERKRSRGRVGSADREIEGLVRGVGGESEFVRAALLIALGEGRGAAGGRALGREFGAGEPGELVRAAWVVMGLSADGGPGLEIKLGDFGSDLSWSAFREGLSTWPAVFRRRSTPEMVDLARSALLPDRLYTGPHRGEMSQQESREGIYTREVIVLSIFGPGAGVEGALREELLAWAVDSDMNHACLWVLARAARGDAELARRLGLLATRLGLFGDGSFLMGLLAGTPGVEDLVVGLLREKLLSDSAPGPIAEIERTNAIFALGEWIEAGGAELAESAAKLLVELVGDPARPEDVRFLSLVQLGVSSPEHLGQGVLGVLLGSDSGSSGSLRTTAADLARSVPEEQRAGVKQALLDSYWDGLSQDSKEAYVRSLMSFGGSDSARLLQLISSSNTFDSDLEDALSRFLDENQG